MKKKNKWFNNNKGYGYITYKRNGKVLIYLSVGNTLKKIELDDVKQKTSE